MKIKMMTANLIYDTNEQVVRHRQLVTYVGAGLITANYVVRDMTFDRERGFMYTLINTKTFESRMTNMIRKEGQRFGIGYYRPDDMVELMPEAEYKAVCNKASERLERKTKAQKPLFYTENGREGCRYNPKLSTKDIAAQVKEYCRKQYPDYKFSVRSMDSAGCSDINVTLISGAYEVMSESGKMHGYMQTTGIDLRDRCQVDLTPEGHDMLTDITAYAKSYNRSDSDGMQDYFDETFYFRLDVGTWSKPYAVVPLKEQAAAHRTDVPMKTNILKQVEQKFSEADEPMTPTAQIGQEVLF